ncbi:histidinol-phosphate transaminase [Metabacillus sediminilitoris]|uniref:Histidinol-phosphate aminotransferase n=1 Tax=Metabacillus sediminilitoris TaxID=2567941 RepID=A0A4S4C5G0_9BACI|nr:histidinol-phosphate transaminase [Metabacillus sediminilitoris]QGQ46684.1 histidinol-phosphate transaminase [Metabacillus sediminilitoris]THF82834.1 histidinol-phosphate transaminase [Metabacillus sediminilitoris]
MQVKEQLLQLKPYQPGKPIEEVKKEFNLTKVVKLASNENPFGCSPKVKQAILDELEQLAIYPDGYAALLRTKVANHVGVNENEIIFGNGTDEVIQIICRALLNPQSNTVMATPTFPQYKHNAVIEGAEIREVPLVNGDHDLDSMLVQIDENTKIVWICTPNNPVGTYVKKQALLDFLTKVPKHVLVIVDEAYYEYVTAEDYPQTVPLLKDNSNLMILRTFSKAYGLAALRIGYGLGNVELINKIEPAREPFNTNRVAQAAAIAALGDVQFVEECQIKNKQGLQQFYDFCEELKLNYYTSEGNFILIDFNRDSDELFQALLKRGYIVRSGNALGVPNHLRITIGTEQQNAEIIQILKDFIL